MKAAVLYEPGRLKIEDVPVPENGDREVLVQVKATAICGTDVSIYKGRYGLKSYPVIQGHESAGVIVDIGKHVTRVRRGDPVIINPSIFCGHCFCCLHSMSNLCENGGMLGKDLPGTFAEYVSVPESNLTVLPEQIGFENASSLQSLVTVLRAWEHVSARPGDTVAVIGMGAPGLLHVKMAALSGAEVYAITRSRWKLDLAEQYGGIPVEAGKEDPVQTVLKATGGRGADLVIETAGTEQTHAQAAEMARPGGTLLIYAALSGNGGFHTRPVFFKELKVVGTRGMTQAGYEKAVDLYSSGKLDLSPLITHRFSLKDTAQMFDMIHTGSEKTLRAVCVF